MDLILFIHCKDVYMDSNIVCENVYMRFQPVYKSRASGIRRTSVDMRV